jgi:hypothetical protein
MSAAAGASNTGDKVTLAVLSTKLDIVIAKLEKVDCAVDAITLEQGIEKTQIGNIWKDIDDNIKPAIKRDTWIAGIATAIGVLGSYFGLKS